MYNCKMPFLQSDLLDLRSKKGIFFQFINSPAEIEKAKVKELTTMHYAINAAKT